GGNALVLIDGVEGDPSMLNPDDVESISVLKDAASAAVYGARGAFGVLLLTTNKPTRQGVSIIHHNEEADPRGLLDQLRDEVRAAYADRARGLRHGRVYLREDVQRVVLQLRG